MSGIVPVEWSLCSGSARVRYAASQGESVSTYLSVVFGLANSANVLSTLMFLARVHRPHLAGLFGRLAIALGLRALIMGIWGLASHGIAYSLPPLLYAQFAAFALVVDVIRKIEFRQPRRPGILIPFLSLFYVSLMTLWGMTWSLGVGYWAVTGLTYLATVASSLYAVKRGVG